MDALIGNMDKFGWVFFLKLKQYFTAFGILMFYSYTLGVNSFDGDGNNKLSSPKAKVYDEDKVDFYPYWA